MRGVCLGKREIAADRYFAATFAVGRDKFTSYHNSSFVLSLSTCSSFASASSGLSPFHARCHSGSNPSGTAFEETSSCPPNTRARLAVPGCKFWSCSGHQSCGAICPVTPSYHRPHHSMFCQRHLRYHLARLTPVAPAISNPCRMSHTPRDALANRMFRAWV